MSEFSIGEFSRDRVSHVSEVVWVTRQVKYDPQGNGSHQVVEQVKVTAQKTCESRFR